MNAPPAGPQSRARSLLRYESQVVSCVVTTSTIIKTKKMSDGQLFILRPVVRPAANATLDGAFRVHVSAKDLKSLSLEPGELCQLVVPDSPSMLGFIWLAPDLISNNPKRIAKITETLKDTYNLNFQDRISIEKADSSLLRADKVYVTEIGQGVGCTSREELAEVEYWAGQSLCKSQWHAYAVSHADRHSYA